MCAFTHCATSCGAAGRDAPDLSPTACFALGQCCILFVAFSFWRLWCHRIFLDKEERGDTVETREDVGWCHQLPGMVTPKLRPHVQCRNNRLCVQSRYRDWARDVRTDVGFVPLGSQRNDWRRITLLVVAARGFEACREKLYGMRSPDELLHGKQRHSASTVHATT